MSCSPQTCNAEGNQHHPENTQMSPRAENKVEKSHLKNRPDEAAARTSSQPRQATRVAHGVVYLAAIRGTPRAPSSAQVTPPERAGWPAAFSFPRRRQEFQLRQAQRGRRQPWLRGDMAAAPAGAQGPPGKGGWRSPAPSWMLGRASAEKQGPHGWHAEMWASACGNG